MAQGPADKSGRRRTAAMMIWFRGAVHSSSFGIENELILLGLAEDFGTNDHGTVGSDYFDREQTWREDHRLDVKIERVKPIIRKRRADSDLIRPGIPTRSRPPFRFKAGRRSETKPATNPI
jgi:hypothetical protein